MHVICEYIYNSIQAGMKYSIICKYHLRSSWINTKWWERLPHYTECLIILIMFNILLFIKIILNFVHFKWFYQNLKKRNLQYIFIFKFVFLFFCHKFNGSWIIGWNRNGVRGYARGKYLGIFSTLISDMDEAFSKIQHLPN